MTVTNITQDEFWPLLDIYEGKDSHLIDYEIDITSDDKVWIVNTMEAFRQVQMFLSHKCETGVRYCISAEEIKDIL